MTATLPPTSRDFEIHRLHLVQHVSTRAIAEKHDLSQTRIRQIARRVCNWLAEALPIKTELEQEQEMRLAQHLAADQLQHQIEQLQIFWNETHDPKYLRQQTRVIVALARLGIIPGTIDSLAADVSSRHTPCAVAEDVQSPMSKVQSQASSTLDLGPETLDFPPPPPGDCSPLSHSSHADILPTHAPSDATPSDATTSEDEAASLELDLQGLNLIEHRLLTLLEQASSEADADRRASLQNTLTIVRRNQAAIQLQLSPNSQGANLQTHADPVSSPLAGSKEQIEQEQTEITQGIK